MRNKTICICLVLVLLIMMNPTAVYSADIFLSSPSVAQPTEKIVVNYSNAPTDTNTVFIAMMPASAPKTPEAVSNQRIGLEYLSSSTGTVTFEAPWETGEYRFDMYINKDTVYLGSSNTITVEHKKVLLSVLSESVSPEQKVSVSYTNAPTLYSTYIVMMKESSDSTPASVSNNRLALMFLDNSKSEGSVEFTTPKEPGRYNFRIFTNRDTILLGTSSTILVGANDTGAANTEDFTAENVSSGIKLRWNNIANNKFGYRVYRSEVQGAEGISVTDFPISTNEFVDVNIKEKTTYYYTVKAVEKEANPMAGEKEVLSSPYKMMTITSGSQILGNSNVKTGSKSFILMQLLSPYMSVNGVKQEVDPGRGTAPQVVSSRTMIPIRASVEAIGGTVEWVEKENKIAIKYNGIELLMWLGKKEIKVNGKIKSIDVAPASINGRTMVPVRFVAENLNCEVDWIASSKQIVIVYWN